MAQLKLCKHNIFDLIAAVVVLLLVLMLGLYYMQRPKSEESRLRVIVEISDARQVSVITGQATKDKRVYLDSINVPVTVESVSQKGEFLEITLIGPGHLDGAGYYIFNGQRLLVGQKAEIHANYFAQGKIVSVENAK